MVANPLHYIIGGFLFLVLYATPLLRLFPHLRWGIKIFFIYNDELKRLSNEYGEKARGTVSLKQIHDDLGASAKTNSTAGSGGTIDITV